MLIADRPTCVGVFFECVGYPAAIWASHKKQETRAPNVKVLFL